MKTKIETHDCELEKCHCFYGTAEHCDCCLDNQCDCDDCEVCEEYTTQPDFTPDTSKSKK